MKDKKCCFCGNVIKGYGNNPYGAMCLNEDGVPVKMDYKERDLCCDECDNKFVLPGRIYLLRKERGK